MCKDATPVETPMERGWLEGVQRCPSPHRAERPSGVPVDLLVIHNISLPPNEFGGEDITRLFLGTLDTQAHPFYAQLKGLTVSSHLLVRRDGEIIQYVSFYDAAWHAGVSEFEGREKCNDFSIGIELEGADDIPYELVQYERLLEVTAELIKVFPNIAPNRIVGHSDIAPGRKTDPGPAFDWKMFRKKVQLLYNKNNL